MRVRLFLRAILVLAFAGLFVAGFLSITKLLNLVLPCGPGKGCDTVNNHPSSFWFGIPVAVVGLIGYVLIAGLAIARSSMTPQKARPLALAGYLLSAFGAIASVGLQIYSFTVIQATCLWCLGSAAIMVLLLVFHALEYGDRVSEEVPKGPGEFALISALAVLVGVSLTGMTVTRQKSMAAPPVMISEQQLAQAELVPKSAHSFGDANAPVTIVEFADLMCPSCQQNSPRVKEFVQKHPGKVRLVYRHFPIEQLHRLGPLAAAVAEVAADEGKFWDFTTALMATGENIQDVNRLWEVAQGVRLDVEKIKKRLGNDKDSAYERLTADKNAANALGITTTPTFIVKVEGMETQAYGFPRLMQELESGVYKKYIGGS